MARNTLALSEAQWAAGKFVGIGLDVEYDRIPAHLKCGTSPYEREMTMNLFLRGIVDATHDVVHFIKPNQAFYAKERALGLRVLSNIMMYIHGIAPTVPTYLDYKRGDTGNSSQGYAAEGLEVYGADAITISPYMGLEDGCQPFLTNPDKMAYVLGKTSTRGSKEFQDGLQFVEDPEEIEELGGLAGAKWFDLANGSRILAAPLYQRVTYRVSRHWNQLGNCGLVVGATFPEQLAEIRQIAPDLPLLLPGVGSQGGDHAATVKAARHRMGINLSRSALYASSGRDFAEAARAEVIRVNTATLQYLNA